MLRSIFGQVLICAIFWLIGRQLGLGLYLLLGGIYQILILSYHAHFHFVPSLHFVIVIRHEALVIATELIKGGFLLLEISLVGVYALVFLILHMLDASLTGEYLDAILKSVAPLAGVGLAGVILLGMLWVKKTNQASIGQMFFYHNMLKLFGPFSWQVMYSFASSERNKYNRSLPLVDLPALPGAPVQNIIFIQLESVGSEMVFADFEGAPVLPNLRRLAVKGQFFPEVISAKGRGGTSDVELALFTGRMHESSSAPMLDEYYDYSSSIFLKLGQKGYGAYAFHGNTGAFFKRAFAYKQMGADFYDQARMELPDAGWGAADGDVLRFAGERLMLVHQPIAAAIILMTSHTPFSNIDAVEPAPRGAKDDIYTRYCRSLRYVDREVNDFMARYTAQRPNAVFLIYSDHAARVRGHEVYTAVTHNETKRDLVPASIIGEAKLPSMNSVPLTIPDLALIALIKAGVSVTIKSDSKLFDVMRVLQ